MFSSETGFEPEFRVVVSSAEWFGTELQVFAYIFVPRKGIPGCFLFRGMVQDGIPSICILFCSMVKIPSIFLLCRTIRNGIPRIFCSAEQPEFRRNKQFFRLFRRKLPTLEQISPQALTPCGLLGCRLLVSAQSCAPLVDCRNVERKLSTASTNLRCLFSLAVTAYASSPGFMKEHKLFNFKIICYDYAMIML